MKRVISFFLLLTIIICLPVTVFAADPVTREYEYTLQNPNEEITDYEKNIEIDGKKYKAKDTDVKIISESPVMEEKTLTDTLEFTELKSESVEGIDVPDTLQIEHCGESYTATLQNITYEPYVVTDRTVNLTETVAYGLSVNEPRPEQYFVTSYYDEELGEELTLNIPYSHLRTVQDWHWEDCTYTCTFYGWGNAFYKLYDKYIPYNADEPVTSGFESEILRYLELPESSYRVTGGAWDGEAYVSDDGTENRDAIIYGQRRVGQFTAVYSGDVALPDLTRYTAAAHYSITTDVPSETKVVYNAVLTVTYVPAVNTIAVISAAAGIAILAAAIVILLIAAAKKKKRREKIKTGINQYAGDNVNISKDRYNEYDSFWEE